MEPSQAAAPCLVDAPPQIGTAGDEVAHCGEAETQHSGSQLSSLPSPRQWGWVDSQLVGWREDDGSGKQPEDAKCVNLATLVRKAEGLRQRNSSSPRAMSKERKALARRLLREATA